MHSLIPSPDFLWGGVRGISIVCIYVCVHVCLSFESLKLEMRVAVEEGSPVSKASPEGQDNTVLCMGLSINFLSSSHFHGKDGQVFGQLVAAGSLFPVVRGLDYVCLMPSDTVWLWPLSLFSSFFLIFRRRLCSPNPPAISPFLFFTCWAPPSPNLNQSPSFPYLWPKRFRCMFYISSSFVASLTNLFL